MPLLYSYYGDDFTGSTDVLEQLAANGVASVLFVSEPTPAQMARFTDRQAIGFAGVDVCAPAGNFSADESVGAGDRSLQGLFHF
jgi:hypothetical protein